MSEQNLKIEEEYIKKAIETFYNLIKDKGEGGPDTRYRSWEYCYEAFNNKRKEYRNAEESEQEEIVDYLSLHLAFYLASWGMYRGSSFLLQRDYKAHKNIVKLLLEEKYDELWGYTPIECESGKDSSANILIFKEDGLYQKIKDMYRECSNNIPADTSTTKNDETDQIEDNSGDIATDTLVTKILMGTMGCVPAFDRFLKKGISWLKGRYNFENISCSIENKGKTYGVLERFAIANKDAFDNCGISKEYPIMKRVDMFLWEIGYEFDLLDQLKDEKKKNKWIAISRRLNDLGIKFDDNSNFEQVKNAIFFRWK